MSGDAGPGSLVGIFGGGQLGRMLALAGIPLGFRFRFLEPKTDCPVRGLGEVIHAEYDDPVALEAFGEGLDVATYEFENVPVASVRSVAAAAPVLPPASALEVAQDRLREKEAFLRLGIPTAPFRAVDDRSDLDEAVHALGLPAVLKTRRFGYDGKGQHVLREPADVDVVWKAVGGVPLLLESFVEFLRELSILSVRGRTGEVAHYPLAENEHREGILRLSRAPAPSASHSLTREAERVGRVILEDLDYVGVLAVELFETESGLLANELAPRVHNTGHWTQDGAVTSQFENHLRAITGLSLGSTEPRGRTAMVNIVGSALDSAGVAGLRGAHLHLYGKEPCPGRKIGHVNIEAPDPEELERRLDAFYAHVPQRP